MHSYRSSHRELTLSVNEQAALSDFGKRQQAESARIRMAELRVKQRMNEAAQAMSARASQAKAEVQQHLTPRQHVTPRQQTSQPVQNVPPGPAHHEHHERILQLVAQQANKPVPVPVPAKQPPPPQPRRGGGGDHRNMVERADLAADRSAETAAKAIIRTGTVVPKLGEVCEQIAQEKQVLGAGGFGVVYRGVISGLGEVAVKRLERQAGKTTEDDTSDFANEIAIMKLAEHPNLLRMLACAASKSARYLVYPFISGGDLLSFLGCAHPSSRQHTCRVGIAQDVVSGLRALHAHTPIVLHRDLKPQNVLLSFTDIRHNDGRPRALLADFGQARFSPELTRGYGGGGGVGGVGTGPSHLTSRYQVGTFGYQAPEIMLGQYSTASDVYSLGVLLLQTVTGRQAVVMPPTPAAQGQGGGGGGRDGGGADGKKGGMHLSAWAREARARRHAGLADSRADWPWRVAESLVCTGLECCASAAAARPSLDAVAARLGALDGA